MSHPTLQRTSSMPLRLCTFFIADRIVALDISVVREVVQLPAMTPIPHAPASVWGCVNLRGQICLVVDPRVVLGLPRIEPSPESRLIVLRPHVAEGIGLLVDRIGDVVTTYEATMEPVDVLAVDASATGHFFTAAVKQDELSWILDVKTLLSAVESAVALAGEY